MLYEILNFRHTNMIPSLSKDSIFMLIDQIGYINVGELK
jgi:hypothetical protein